ncbi:MAG: hypothetical protein HY692_06500 [Cyanobacteria bacterium NC_groundwater_1444_Ag_S-0.65um_54_12]|nr:hypothetical protein [Cyanobacteria bacterium NC_groundwater_1444_Ag_S-0.65um_54_12]
MVISRQGKLHLPFRFLRAPGSPLETIVLSTAQLPRGDSHLLEVRLRAPYTNHPALDCYLESAPMAAAALTVDRLDLEILWETPQLPDFALPDALALDLEQASSRISQDVLARFLFYLKFRTHTFWLGPAGLPIGGEIAWRQFDGQTIHVSQLPQPPLVPGNVLTDRIWEQIRQDLQHNFEPEVHEIALMQAKELLFIGMRPIAILGAAVACETKAKRIAEQLQARKPGGLMDPLYQKLAGRHAKIPTSQIFSSVLDLICGHNLMREDKTLFQAIETLFQVRNTIAHTGRCAIREGNSEQEVDLSLAAHLITAVEQAGKWLDQVAAKFADGVVVGHERPSNCCSDHVSGNR